MTIAGRGADHGQFVRLATGAASFTGPAVDRHVPVPAIGPTLSSKPFVMRPSILTLALMAGSCTPVIAQNTTPEAGAEAIVTLHVNTLHEANWDRFATRIGREPGANIEYACARAGILVLRMQHLAVVEKADVMSVVRRLLNEGGISGAVEFLDLHIEEQSWGECRATP